MTAYYYKCEGCNDGVPCYSIIEDEVEPSTPYSCLYKHAIVNWVMDYEPSFIHKNDEEGLLLALEEILKKRRESETGDT